MIYTPFFKKIKVLALSVAMLAGFAVAGEGSFNYYGQLGVHKTQSAQTLGHGRLGLGFFLEGADLYSTIEGENFRMMDNPNAEPWALNNYLGGNFYLFLSLGLSDYFDISASIPAYGEYLRVRATDVNETYDKYLSSGGQGNVFISIKLGAPLGPVDLALNPGIGINTGKENHDNQYDYGAWVRDPMFINVSETYRMGTNGLPSSYTNSNNFFKLGFAGTMDFNRIPAKIPLLFHLNYAYRWTLGTDGKNFPNVSSFATALEWTPVEFVSLYGEYYTDMPAKWPTANDTNITVDLNTVSLGTSFHLSKHTDIQLGTQIFVGNKDKYMSQLTTNLGTDPRSDNKDNQKIVYNARLVPDYTFYGGITVKLFTMEPTPVVEEEEEEEYRNPDTDGDGVCDPWVSETGRQREFKKICSGIDLCPYEEGPASNKGCPEKQADAAPAPTILFTVSPDVVNKGQSVTLTWQVTNASSVEIDGIGTVDVSGSKKVKPTANTTYTLTAKGEGGTKSSSVDVELAAGPVPSILFSANPESVQTGHPVTLKWEVTNSTEVKIDNGIGKVQPKGSKQVKPTSTTAYTLTAVGEGGTKSETVDVEVTEPPPIEARVNLQGVTFGSGNATLTLNAKKVLDGVAEQLLANPKVKIEIQGHTDNQGKPATNQDLSERRAKAVVGYLATKGVSTSRMKAVGYGQDVPIGDNKTAEGRELNRRIEMVRVDD